MIWFAFIDFGSAKILVKGEPNVAYICSRYYRAPELVFEAVKHISLLHFVSTFLNTWRCHLTLVLSIAFALHAFLCGV